MEKKKQSHFWKILAFFLFVPMQLQAQGLTLQAEESAPALGSFNYAVLSLIILRYLFVSTLVIAGVVAIFKTYLWLTHEGNMQKAYDAKQSLSKAVLIITICFIALSIMRIFIPDYAQLQL